MKKKVTMSVEHPNKLSMYKKMFVFLWDVAASSGNNRSMSMWVSVEWIEEIAFGMIFGINYLNYKLFVINYNNLFRDMKIFGFFWDVNLSMSMWVSVEWIEEIALEWSLERRIFVSIRINWNMILIILMVSFCFATKRNSVRSKNKWEIVSGILFHWN